MEALALLDVGDLGLHHLDVVRLACGNLDHVGHLAADGLEELVGAILGCLELDELVVQALDALANVLDLGRLTGRGLGRGLALLALALALALDDVPALALAGRLALALAGHCWSAGGSTDGLVLKTLANLLAKELGVWPKAATKLATIVKCWQKSS